MRKRIIWMLALCLAVCGCASVAGAAEHEMEMRQLEPAAMYDGTVLRIWVDIEHVSDEVALVESNLLDPRLQEEPEAKEALATGARLMGVSTEWTVWSDNVPLPEYRVFLYEQHGRVMTAGTIYVLPPDTPHERLTAMVCAALIDPADGSCVEMQGPGIDIPAVVEAETVTFPVDIDLDGSRVSEVFVSSSSEAFCVFLRCDGEMWPEASFTDRADGGPHPMSFALNEDYNTTTATRWSMYVFEPVQGLPDKITLTLIDGTNECPIEIDLAGKTASLL